MSCKESLDFYEPETSCISSTFAPLQDPSGASRPRRLALGEPLASWEYWGLPPQKRADLDICRQTRMDG